MGGALADGIIWLETDLKMVFVDYSAEEVVRCLAIVNLASV